MSVLGVGAAERKSQVRCGVLTDIAALASLLTIPATAILAVLAYLVISKIM